MLLIYASVQAKVVEGIKTEEDCNYFKVSFSTPVGIPMRS